MTNLATVVEQLQQERKQVQGQVRSLDKAISVLKKLAGRIVSANGSKTTTMMPRRKMSAAGRRRISLAQKARWAAWKARQVKKAA
jgi:hypothetical protein